MPQITPWGWSENTAAMRGILGRIGNGNGRGKRKRRSKSKVRAAAKRTKRRVKRAAMKRAAKSGGAKFVKGSAAAKKHMAKLRKLAAKARRG